MLGSLGAGGGKQLATIALKAMAAEPQEGNGGGAPAECIEEHYVR